MQSFKCESVILWWRFLVRVQSIFYALEHLLVSGSLVCDFSYRYIEQPLKTDYTEDSEY